MSWRRIDQIIMSRYPHLNSSDVAGFAREYQPGQGYQAGQTNQLINNFKKDISKKNTPQWYWRNQAVGQFASEFNTLIGSLSVPNIYVTSIPSSKTKNDPNYDNRFEDMFSILKSNNNKVIDVWPVTATTSTQSSHLGGTRNPSQIMANYQWNGFSETEPTTLFVLDDVVTSGSHFRAFSDFCRANNYNGEIIGVFWARCI